MCSDNYIQAREAELLACETSEDAFEVIAKAFARFGFVELFYSYAALKFARGKMNDLKIQAIIPVYHTLSDEAFAFYTRKYNKERLFESDPALVPFYHGQTKPFFSGLGYVELGMLEVTPPQRAYLEASTSVMGTGRIIVPVMTPETKRLPSGSITAMCWMQGEELKTQTEIALRYLPHLVEVFEREIVPKTADMVGRDIKMTRREKECLQLISDGLRPIDVAEELDISKSMVDRHIGSARIKLRARTLPQAIARGISLELIQA